MSARLTKEEFIRRVNERNNHVRNGDIEIRSEFVGTKKPVECFCKIHNISWNMKAEDLFKGTGCRKCGAEKGANKIRICENTINAQLDNIDSDIVMIGGYLGMAHKATFKCHLNHTWESRPADILNGKGCPYCSGKRVLIGFNDLWTTRPDVAKMLNNPEDGYKYTYGSHKKLEFVCNTCGSIIIKPIKDICNRGLYCKICSDGVSYPNKFGRCLLNQLDVDCVKYEWSPDWLRPYSYDNYFEYCGAKYALEMDGGLGHGKKKYKSNDIDVIGIERDIYKDSLAISHGINVLRIDCDYCGINNRYDYIKNSILQSELNNIFDLSNIDWNYCDIQSQKTLVKQVADLYNQGLCVYEIQSIVGYYIETIRIWLRKAAQHGLCDYNRNDSRKRTEYFFSLQIN